MIRRRKVNYKDVAETNEQSKLDGDGKSSNADSINIHKKRVRRKQHTQADKPMTK